MGWLDKIELLYLNSLLETGHDIIFFWVARMVFFGQHLLGKLPFKEVFLYSMVKDAHDRKMSKSFGNVIDPMDVITGISLEDVHKTFRGSNLVPIEVEKAKAGQKQDYQCDSRMWRQRSQICSLCLFGQRMFVLKVLSIDKWMLSSTTACYNLWLDNLCDVNLECLKPVFSSGDEQAKTAALNALHTTLDASLRLLLPFIFMPFLTKELYQRLPRKNESSTPIIFIASYPEVENCSWRDAYVENKLKFTQKIVKGIRSARSNYNLLNNVKTEYAKPKSQLQPLSSVISTLCYCSKVEFEEAPSATGCAIRTVCDKCEVHLVLQGLIDPARELVKIA